MKKQTITLIILAALFVLFMVCAVIVYSMLDVSLPDNLVENDTYADTEAVDTNSSDTEDYSAPDFTVTDADGNEVKLSSYFGTPIVLNFWASWCGPCKSEMPHFNDAAEKYDGEVIFLMVNMTDGSRETVSKAKAYVTGEGYTFPVLYDTKEDAAVTYAVYSLPTTYFIDSEGTLIAGATGAIDSKTLEKGIGMIK